MRIGVDVTCWANTRGYGRFTRELVPAMVAAAPDEQFVCFADRRAAEGFKFTAPNVELVEVALRQSPTTAAAADSYRSPVDMLRLTRAVARASVDVFLSPTVYTYFPLPLRTRAVVTIFDTIAERYPDLTLPTRRARLFWKLKVTLALKQARLVLTASEYAARDLTAVLRVPAERIRVAPAAPARAFHPSPSLEHVAAAASRVGLPPGAQWFTYVGGFNPHKRVDALLRAHAKLGQHAGDRAPYLLLVGTRTGDVFHRQLEALDQLIASLGTKALIRWTGYVPDDELSPLQAGAIASILASECEGFGLPAVEAAACATPVIATTASPLPEILEGGGIFVPPGDVSALTEAMETLLHDVDLRTAMGRRARMRAMALSWDHTAQIALQTLHEAAA